ncbi:MAG: T9SS type A sorting domain-containing protein [Porphyromonadaceae bacterium]|nr:T9SS type A sorting domain-containing protein [Porphyromonadaceae bacterium]
MRKLLTFLILPIFAIIGLQAQTDVTNTYLLNPNFELATAVSTTIESWTNLNNAFQTQNNDGLGNKDGVWYAEKWQSGGNLENLKLSQQVTGLPNGKYLLIAAAFTNQNYGGAFIFANGKKTEVFNTNDYSVIFDVTDGSLGYGFEVVKSSNWVGCDNFRLYELGTDPYLEVNVTSLSFDVAKTVKTFFVKGTNLTSNATLVPPTGVTLSKTSLTPAEVENGTTITATYDGSTTIAEGAITVSSGSASHSILVTATAADAACYIPLYTDRPNLIPDPLLNSLNGFGGWGLKSITNVAGEPYCGDGAVKFEAETNDYPDGAALDVSMTWKPNTTYRVKVKVKAVDGDIALLANGTAPNFLYIIPQSNDEWVEVDKIIRTGTNAGNGFLSINNVDGEVTGKIAFIDNYELYEIFEAPTLVVNPIELMFDAINLVREFEVKGTNLHEDITITPPVGITLDVTTISYTDANDGVVVNAEYDFEELIEGGVIEVKSGDLATNITVNAYNFSEGTCFEPLYIDKENLIKDPFLNSLATYAGWGNREIISDERAYCFRSVFVDGKCGGSLDYHLTGIVKPYTTYRVRAKVSTNGTGTGKIGISGLGIPNVYQPFESEAGEYITVDFVFTAGGSLNNPNMYLNSCESETATELYLDNYEMYELDDPAIIIDPKVLSFDSMHSLDSVFVLGQNLTENITITVPSGVTIEENTIDATEAASGLFVKFTYDKAFDITGGEVTFTSGDLSKTLTVNASRYLINGDFERPLSEGWTTNDGDMVRQTNNSFPLKTGGHYVEKWIDGGGNLSAFTLSQTILGIPNGSYTVKANAQAVQQADGTNPGGAFIIAGNNGVEVIETAEYSVDVEVVDESLTLGFQVVMTGNWVAVDNFRLIDNNAQGVNSRHSLDGVNTFILNNRVHADINLDKNATTTISVYNINGVKMAEKEVALQAGENRVVVDKELARGVYLVEVVADGKFAAFKLIK